MWQFLQSYKYQNYEQVFFQYTESTSGCIYAVLDLIQAIGGHCRIRATINYQALIFFSNQLSMNYELAMRIKFMSMCTLDVSNNF